GRSSDLASLQVEACDASPPGEDWRNGGAKERRKRKGGGEEDAAVVEAAEHAEPLALAHGAPTESSVQVAELTAAEDDPRAIDAVASVTFDEPEATAASIQAEASEAAPPGAAGGHGG